MSVVFLVLPLALLVVLAAVLAYTWAARRGQFDDLTTPAMRVLHEDGEVAPPDGARAGEAHGAPESASAPTPEDSSAPEA